MKTKILLLLFVISTSLSAQILEPVKWSVTENKTSENTMELRYSATIDEGWHLYSNILPDGGPLATEVTYSILEGVELDGALVADREAIEEYSGVFSMVLNNFKDNVTFVQRLKLLSPQYKIAGEVRYMACDDGTCIPPTTVDFEFASSPNDLLTVVDESVALDP
ncbi:MAG: thiol:disulfide interchange protein, partial [Muribaculaceae bacterium]|nr:thiol:disulfide interchange protein [Muribaculaceae bacterium]